MSVKCQKCNDTCLVAIRTGDGTYARPGPVPDDAKGLAECDCWFCGSGGTSGPGDTQEQNEERSMTFTDEQINHMVQRFLAWKLPNNFSPDAGISFKAEFNEHTPHPMKHEPSGTNLLTSYQATAMVRHMLEDMPS